MSPTLLFTFSLASSFVACLFLQRYSFQLGLMDNPGARKLQKSPTPRSGGLAIVFTYAFVSLTTGHFLLTLSGMGALVVYLGGLFDDRRPNNTVLIKLTFQIAGALLAATDLYLNYNLNFGLSIVCFGFILVMINSFNLMDNMNGLTAGMSLALTIGFYYIGLTDLLQTTILGGALLGFLFLNFPLGRIFLGDQGSQFLGYWMSLLAIQGLSSKLETALNFRYIIYSAIFLAFFFMPFIFDTVLVIFIRLRNGKPITVGDQNHLSHQLLKLGLNTNWVAVLMVTLQTICISMCFLLVSYSKDLF